MTEAPASKNVGPRRTARRAIWAGFTFVVSAFVVSLIWQVASVLFGAGASGAAGSRRLPDGPCRSGLVELETRIDEALAAAAAQRDEEAASRLFDEARRGEDARFTQVAASCEGVAHGPEAAAALARLSRAAESAVRLRSSSLASVRREVDSFIRAGR